MLGVAAGTHYPTAVLSVRRTDGLQVEFTRFTLSDVLIISYQPSNQSATTWPTEQFSLTYGRIQFDYWVVNPDGTQGENVSVCWDIPGNRRC